jgi:hypothetical protein
MDCNKIGAFGYGRIGQSYRENNNRNRSLRRDSQYDDKRSGTFTDCLLSLLRCGREIWRQVRPEQLVVDCLGPMGRRMPHPNDNCELQPVIHGDHEHEKAKACLEDEEERDHDPIAQPVEQMIYPQQKANEPFICAKRASHNRIEVRTTAYRPRSCWFPMP